MAGLQRIPAIVRGEVGPDQSLLLGLIENLQRQDLDPIEEARSIRRLIEQFGLTHEEAATRLGKHRVAISQALRLLNGCPALVSATAAGAISAGHARALVGLPTPQAQEHGLKLVLSRQLSVRQTERWVRGYQPQRPRLRAAGEAHDAALAEVARSLSGHLELPVTLTGSLRRGRLSIEFTSQDQLDALFTLLTS